jgi:hypothetical protein
MSIALGKHSIGDRDDAIEIQMDKTLYMLNVSHLQREEGEKEWRGISNYGGSIIL